MSKIGRNDQCHCGSGKKYKKCCIDKDQAEWRAQHEEEMRKNVAYEDRPSYCYQKGDEDELPEEDFWDEGLDEKIRRDFIAEFDQLEFSDRVVYLANMLEAKDELIPYVAFEIFDKMQSAADNGIRREQVNNCINLMRTAFPEVFLSDVVFYARWYIVNNLAAGNYEGISLYFNEAAAMSVKGIDAFTEMIDMLAYHGLSSQLLEGMNLAWPRIRNSAELMEWAVDDFTLTLSDLETFDWLEKTAKSENPDIDELYTRMKSLFPNFDATHYQDYLARIKGESTTDWTMKDLELTGKVRSNIGLLCQDFLGYLRQHEGVSFTKGNLACFAYVDYLLERHDGELTSRNGRIKVKRGRNSQSHTLCPDSETLDLFLSRKMNMFSRRVYKVGAILELIPAWLRFLESKGLIDHDQKENTFAELMSVQATWLKILTRLSSDRALLSGVSIAWSA